MKRRWLTVATLLVAVGASSICAYVTVDAQFAYIEHHHGADYVTEVDRVRHERYLDGSQPAPYRYRLLSHYAFQLALDVAGVDTTAGYRSVARVFRLLQNFGIFLLAFVYLRGFGLRTPLALVGLALLSYGMCFAFYQADLSLYVYSELALFVLAAVLLQRKWDRAVILLAFVAAFDRESSVLIPCLLLAARVDWASLRWRTRAPWLRQHRGTLAVFGLSLAAFLAVRLGLWLALGSAEYAPSRYGAVFPGVELLVENVQNPLTWSGLLQMFGPLPLLLFFVRRWPRFLKASLALLVGPWVLGQFVFGSADETRLFLVPFVLVFVPAGLTLVSAGVVTHPPDASGGRSFSTPRSS
jgi:hypothetical protein